MTSKIGCFIMEDCTFEAVYSFCVLEFLWDGKIGENLGGGKGGETC
jgi:hypothetical protein